MRENLLMRIKTLNGTLPEVLKAPGWKKKKKVMAKVNNSQGRKGPTTCALLRNTASQLRKPYIDLWPFAQEMI